MTFNELVAVARPSAPGLYGLQPCPGNIYSTTRTRRQLLECTKTGVEIIRLATCASVHYPQINAALSTNFFVETRSAQHSIAKRVIVAVTSLTRRGPRRIENNVGHRDNVVAVAAGNAASAEACAVVREIAYELVRVTGKRQILT